MKKYLFMILLFLGKLQTYAQGCSDAGFCSLKYHTSDSSQSLFKNSIAIGNVSGIGDGNTFVNGSWLTYSRQLAKKWFADVKITSNFASNTIVKNFNPGDVFFNLSYEASKNTKNKSSLKFLAGLKIPLTDGNDLVDGKPLPMALQASLGTFDALLGFFYAVKKWEFTNAYQIPITQQNQNTYLKEPGFTEDFPSTRYLGRKSDILLRAAYNLKSKTSPFSLKPNFLAIYHIAEDTYLNKSGMRENIKGSGGLTLNANIIANYELNKRSSIELSLATPFIVRVVRPDGLTRKFTAAIEYKLFF